MSHYPFFSNLLAASPLITLMACGGGGSDAGGGANVAVYPATGSYGWILKASGPTNALKYGLSLVHPSEPGTEYVVETANAAVTDARAISSGTVDTAQLRANALQPSYLVYIVGGDVRSVPLLADGGAPGTRVQRAQSSSACKFVDEPALDAVDYGSVQNSRFVIKTAGADGLCETSDDGRAEVKLSATLGVVVTPFASETPLAVVRDSSTLAPRGWLYARSVGLWSGSPAATFPTRTAPALAVNSVVAATYNAALVDDGTRLAVLALPGGQSVTETPLDASITGGGGWKLIGYDAGNFFVYRNAPPPDFSSTYTVLKIARGVPSASVLASGTGLVSLASMGRSVVYLTVFTATDNRLVRIAKLGGTPAQSSFPTTTFLSVQTSAAGVNEVWRVTGVGGAAASYSIDMVDESGATLYTAPGGFPMSVAEATSRDFNTSESRSSFLLASGYGPRGFGDASLVSYDANARSATTLGLLPGSAQFGTDFVFASAVAGPGTQGLVFAARSVNGSVQDAGAKTYRFDIGVANSLAATSLVR